MIWMHLSLEEDSQLDSTLVARMNGEQDIIFNSVLSVCGHGSRTSAARENSTASTTAMPPRPSNKKAPSNNKPARKPLPDKKKPAEGNRQPDSPLDTTTIPLPLQQLLLNVFQSALVPNTPPDPDNNTNTNTNTNTNADPNDSLDLKPLIQTIKSHLYNRDFDSAFTDANEELLRAYALRWSATRALGYAGVFKGVLRLLFGQSQSQDPGRGRRGPGQIVCVGGGAGAEIVALGGVWRDFTSQQDQDQDQDQGRQVQAAMDVTVTAVDIADWSGVVGRLEGAMRSSRTGSGFGSRRYPAPLLSVSSGSHESANSDSAGDGGKFKVNFQRADVLTLTDDQLYRLYNSRPDQEVEGQGKGWTLVTLMFTLNELFSTSMAKTTGFLLRTTDAVQPGSFLLVVDSPGSYSSLTLGKPAAAGPATGGNASKDVERCYPMKFLLDHTLLSVADGKWEKVVSEDSRWWRREADRLGYEVGEGAGLEDMRFQVHIYRRLAA